MLPLVAPLPNESLKLTNARTAPHRRMAPTLRVRSLTRALGANTHHRMVGLLTPERQRELDELAAACLALAAALDDAMPHLGEHSSGRAVAAAVDRRDLTGLRHTRDDFVAGLAAHTPEQRRALDARLRAEAGITLDSLHARQLACLTRLRAGRPAGSALRRRKVRPSSARWGPCLGGVRCDDGGGPASTSAADAEERRPDTVTCSARRRLQRWTAA